MPFLFLLFITVPVAEMVLLIKVGGMIGAFNTVIIVLITATIGINLLRHQGLATLMRANQRLERGDLPAEEVIEGFLLAFAGALLLTPGFMTDLVGFSCLIPTSRRYIVGRLLSSAIVVSARAAQAAQAAQARQAQEEIIIRMQQRSQRPEQPPDHSRSSGHSGHRVIDGEYDRED